MNNYDLSTISNRPFQNFHIERGGVDSDFKIHTHDFCEIMLVLSGTGTHISGDMEYPLKKGELFAVKGSECHGFRNCDTLRVINIMFQVSSAMVEDCKNLPGFWVLFMHEQRMGSISHIGLTDQEFDQVSHWCEVMLHEYTEGSPGCVAICNAVLTQLLVFLSRACQRVPNNMLQPDFRLAKALMYLEANYMEKLDLDQFSAMVGFSKRHFSRLFQMFYHKTPMQHLLEVRIANASRLLTHTDYPVTRIAGMCGFQDGNYFSRVFKRQTGFSPAQWRKIHANNKA